MNPGDSVHDVSRTGPDETGDPGAAAGQGNGTLTRSPRTEKPLQDIQDIIDKLAAVTQQLRRPEEQRGQPVELDRSVPLNPQATEQPCAVGRAERGRAQQRERPDIAGDILLALQVDATR